MWAKIQAGIKAFEIKAKQDWKDIWNTDKAFFFLAGILILIVKFRDVLIDILLNSAKRLFNNATKQDTVLDNQENQDKEQADALVKKAQDEPSKEQPVDDAWNQKNKKMSKM